MNDLRRELAPISDAAWREIDAEARRTLKTMLAARKLVDFKGPLGWDASSVSLGRTQPVTTPVQNGVQSRLRRVQPMVELRVPFELDREELESIGRGADDPDVDPVREAARNLALAEDRAVFHGCPEAGMGGIVDAAVKSRCSITEDYTAYLGSVAEALHKLRSAGIGGPYAIALGPRCYTGLTKTTQAGFPVIEHVKRIVDGPIVWAPGIDGAVVLSQRGGDFELTIGADFAIGYLEHSRDAVTLYLEESMTFRVLAPEAAVPLRYAK